MENIKRQFNKYLFKSLGILAVLLFVAFYSTSAHAAFSPYLNYQGKLTDSSNNPVSDGNYNLSFRLCADSSCASVLWTETHINSDKVAISNGLFSVMLGQVTPLTSLDFNQPLYLEVNVGGTGTPAWETLLPRKILGAVPNAFNAQKLDGLATSSFLRSDLANNQATINNLTSTNLFAANASITNATSTNLFASLLNSLTSVINDLTATWANITTLIFGDATGNNLAVTNLTVTSTANIKTLNTSSTVTLNSTSTNFYSSNVNITGGSIATSTISSLTTGNFTTSSISQWVNNVGYITTWNETDPVFMAASSSLPYLKVETDPIWLAASSSYLTVASATATYLTAVNAGNTYLTQANASTNYLSLATWYTTSTRFLTTTTAAATYQPIGNYLTTSTGLTVANFATSSISQWINNIGYITTWNETDPIFMAASTSLNYVTVETDPIFMAASTSLAYLKVETDPIFMAASTSLPYQPIGNYLTTSTGLTVANFATSSISQWVNNAGYITTWNETDPIWSAASSSYLTLATWLATTTWPNNSLIVNGNSTTTGNSYLGTGTGLSGQYITQWSDLSAYLPTVAGWGTSSDAVYWASSFASSTTDGLTEGSVNKYYHDSLVSTYLNTIDKSYFFSTSSADIWGVSKNYLTTSTGLTVANFATSSISQWVNNAGYITTWNETDPVFMAASTSLAYLKVETDPIFMSASSSLPYLKVETDPIWLAASSSYLTVASATATYLTTVNAGNTYLTQANASTSYLSLATWYATSTRFLTTTTAAATYQPIGNYLTTSTGLTVANFASPNISQWTNDAGYITTSPSAINFWSDTGTYLTPATSTRGLIVNGNVGFGTPSPGDKFEVAMGSSSKITFDTNTGNTNTHGPGIEIYDTAGDRVLSFQSANTVYGPIIQFPTGVGGFDMYNYRFIGADGTYGYKWTTKGAGATSSDRILISGNVATANIALMNSNVGIGKLVPSTALDVVGTVSSTGLRVNGNETLTGTLTVGNLSGLLLGTNGVVSAVSTSSLNLTVSSFATSSISQWTNNAGYITTWNETDPVFMAASSSLAYLKVESDPIFMAASTSLNYLKVETDPIWLAASSSYLTVASATATYLTAVNAANTYGSFAYNSSTFLTMASATAIYLTQTNASTNYLSLATWYATTSVPQFTTLSGLTSIGSSGATTTIAGNLAVNGSSTFADIFLSGLSGNIITSNNIKTAITDLDTRLYNQQNTTKEMTGFPNRTDSSIAFVDGTRTFTITGTNFKVYSAGKEYTKNTQSIAIPNTTGLYFIYYDKTTGALSTSTNFWTLTDGTIPVATVYWSASIQKGLLAEERHGLTMDGETHAYLHSTVGTRYQSGLTGTFNSSRATTTAGIIWDEDISLSLPQQTQFPVYYKIGSEWQFTAAQDPYYIVQASSLIYDNAGTATTTAGNNNYVAYWILATDDVNNPVISVMGQRVDTSIANARANNLYESLSFGTLPFGEMKVLYRVILRQVGGAAQYTETQDLRSVSNLPSGTYVASAHGALTGLLFDDHPQYLLLGGRGGQTISDNIVIGSSSVPYSLTVYGTSSFATTSISTLTVTDLATGPLQSINGVVSATSSISSAYLGSNVMLEGENISLLNNNVGYITTSTGLTVANFATSSISQWINNVGYITTWNETDPVFMAASSSLPYLKVETDPIWLAASSSYLTVASATATYLTTVNAGNTYQLLGNYVTGTPWTGMGYLTVESDPIWSAASTSLSISNFSSPNISQWTNDVGYVTSTAGGTNFWSDDGTYLTPATSTRGLTILGNVGIGTTTPTNRLQVEDGNVAFGYGDTLTEYNLSAPTNATATTAYTGGYFPSNGYTHNYRIYSFKTVNGVKFYSPSYATATFTDDGSSGYYDVNLSWDAVAGADGYRILQQDAYTGTNFDGYTDTTANSYTNDDRYSSGSTVTPNTPYNDTNGTGFFYDAKTKFVGVGTAAPTQKLTVANGAITASDSSYLFQTSYGFNSSFFGDVVTASYASSSAVNGVGQTGYGMIGVMGQGSTVGVAAIGSYLGVIAFSTGDSGIAGQFSAMGNSSDGLYVNTSGSGGTGVHIEVSDANYGLYSNNYNYNNYNIYADGSSKNYFGGNVGIGTTPDTNALNVAGIIHSTKSYTTTTYTYDTYSDTSKFFSDYFGLGGGELYVGSYGRATSTDYNFDNIGTLAVGVMGDGDVGVLGVSTRAWAGYFQGMGDANGLDAYSANGIGAQIRTGSGDEALYVYNGSSTNYAIYSQGGLNYFGGKTNFGDTVQLNSISNSFLWADASGIIVATGTPLMVESDPIWTATSSNYLTTVNAAATYQIIGSYLTTSTGLTVSNFATSSISQWVNNAGYITTWTETDPIWVAASTSYFKLANSNTVTGTTTLATTTISRLSVGTTSLSSFLTLDAGSTTNYSALTMTGSINNYFQLNIKNTSNGASASSDIVATNDTGNENTGYINMGINSSGYTGNIFGGANDTYLYGSSTGNLYVGTAYQSSSIAFLTGGSATTTQTRMTITSAGDVGIGTTLPGTKFEVNGTSTLDNVVMSGKLFFRDNTTVNGSSPYYGIGVGDLDLGGGATKATRFSDYYGLSLATGGSDRLVVNSSGNVGIGTTTPATMLHLYGGEFQMNDNFRIGGINTYYSLIQQNTYWGGDPGGWRSLSGGPGLVITQSGGSNNVAYYDIAISSTSTSAAKGSLINPISAFYIGNNGQIGMGTTIPGYKLDIQNTPASGGDVTASIYNGQGAAAGETATLRLSVNGGWDSTIFEKQGNGLIYKSVYNHTFQDSLGNTLMYIDGLGADRGYVGIGLAAPVGPLHIGTSTASTDRRVILTDATSGQTATDGLQLIKGTDEKGYLWNYENADLMFGTNNTDRLHILATGYVGIGTTTPNAYLNVYGGAATVDLFRVATSTNQNLFIIDKAGNIGIGVAPSSTNQIIAKSNARLTTGGTWTNASDRNVKENFQDVDPNDILNKIVSLPIQLWNYKVEPSDIKHLGPVAQDFFALFGLGGSDTSISTIDPASVALVGVKALQQRLDNLSSSTALAISNLSVSTSTGSQTNLAVTDANPQFNTLRVATAATFYGTMTVVGEAGFESKVTFNKEVEFKDHITVDSDTAGSATITIGATSTQVKFDRPYNLAPKIVANLLSSGTPAFVPYLIADKTTSSFSIILNNPATADLYFDWIALAVKDKVGQVAGVSETAILGCMDSSALNYNSLATQTDGSCTYPSTPEPTTSSTEPIPEVTPPPVETPPEEPAPTVIPVLPTEPEVTPPPVVEPEVPVI